MELVDINIIIDKNRDIKKRNDIQEICLLNSIKKYGQLKPIIINNNNEIIEGHNLFRMLKKLDIDQVYIKKIDNVNEYQLYCELNLIYNEIDAVDFFVYLRDYVNIDNNVIPYSKKELTNFIKLLDFDWQEYLSSKDQEEEQDNNSFFKFM